jgi:hypothetical protein
MPADRGGRTGPPDFVGVGTHLSGTEWWSQLLSDHPAISPPAGGEWALQFFEPFCAREMRDEDVAAYHELFPRGEGTIAGEWSPRYVYDPWTLPLLRRAAPEAKIVLLVRDPIDRYRASLSYRLAERRPEGEPIIMAEAVHRGRYASQLRALTAFFDRDRILVLQYERCRADPLGQYARALRFLGVDDTYVPRRLRRLARGRTGPILPVRMVRALGLPETVNLDWARRLAGQIVPVRIELWPDVIASLRAELTAEVQELGAAVPDVDLSLWPYFSDLALEPAAAAVA